MQQERERQIPNSGEGGGPPGSPASRGIVRRFLRVPLYHKIVVGNSVVVALVALAGVSFAVETAGRAPLGTGVVTAAVLLAVAFMAAANALLVRVALSALDPIEATARRVEQGDLGARCEPSPLADDDLLRLTGVFNDMLDRLEQGRVRQRELAVKVLDAEERERMWLAKQLYDDTAQVLSAALLSLRAAGRSGDSAADATLAPIRAEIVGALDGIKRIARRLRPPELDELGLSAAIRAHARALGEVSGITIDCQAEAVDECLTREARLALYRIVQEALNNAVRHSDASSIEVRVSRDGDQVLARVSDDGGGFDPAVVPVSESGSFGLVGMRERAGYVGGTVTVESSPGHGTQVRVALSVVVPRASETEVGGLRASPSDRR